MAGEKIIEKSEAVAPGLKSDSSTKLTEKDLVSKNDGKVSDSVSSLGAVTGIKGEIDQPPVAEQGYNGTYNQLDDQAYFNSGVQSENGSLLYYMPGYNPYGAGYIGGDGKQPYLSSGYLQQPVSYGSDSMPCYSWGGSTYCADITNSAAPKSGNVKSTFGRNGSVRSNGFNPTKTNGSFSSKNSTMLFNPKNRPSTAISNPPKSIHQAQPFNPANKFQSDVQSGGLTKGYHMVGDFPSYSSQNQGFFMPYDPIHYQTNSRLWNGNYRGKPRGNFTRNGVFEASNELPRGPRANSRSAPSKPSAEEDQLEPTIQREKYNKEDFKTQYDNAKFYIIKSYSEDDIHKCVKYAVWSSTPNGNKKLDTAFLDAEGKASGTDSSCPVFLFFSVNGSGQFLGVAEMVGQVDFNRNMDFWQLDKWSGFFPVKWHIVKDVPNTQFRHIILKNNDNRPVTYSRDTQEIGLKEGLEMLNILKNYSEKTSILDDFNFYEKREKVLKAKRSSKPAIQADVFEKADSVRQFKGGDKVREEELKSNSTDPTASLVSLAKNLSINSRPFKSSV
ncbi:YTH domain-containing protein ECT4 isoform X3 [Capsicum annuum]|uniref:YTH domain-containing protein ECT4 isoform X3 n=1 Tax=Capsicum annuum TaxID=4072 RepID=UPI0007BFD6CD|nr:YTH domain-containing protein ECT4 isoform X3 [Capsicum annuum]